MSKLTDLQEWLDAGYTRWETKKQELHKRADFGLQKAVRDPETGDIRYHIICYCYKWSSHELRDVLPQHELGIMPCVQFRGNKFPTLNVELLTENVSSTEETLAAIWEAVGRPMYE